MVAASRLVALACASATATAMKFDMATMMKIKAFESRFTADSIQQEQKVALMEKYGFNDMQLFMSKQISGQEFKTSMKQNMKDQLIQNILNGGGLDLQNPFVRKTVFGDQDNIEMFSRTTPEPLQSIMRMIRVENVAGRKYGDMSAVMTEDDKTKIKAYGKELLKKYQYKKMNVKRGYGTALTENFDEILLASKDTRKNVIKEILQQSMFEGIADPIDRSLMYYITESRKSANDDATKAAMKDQIKSLQTIKIFQGSVPKSSPVTDDNLYAFYKMVDGKIDESQVLNIALGDQLGPVSEQDFERYFGAPAKQFSCRAHTSVLRVPCGIRLKPDECVAMGCCWDTNSATQGYNADASARPNTDVKCFHDLYGKIGSGILRQSWVKSDDTMQKQIKGLFLDNTIPTLDKILRDDTPYGVATKDGAVDGVNAVEYATGQDDWWEAASMKYTEVERNEDGTEKSRKDLDMFKPGPNGEKSIPDRSDPRFWKDGNAYDRGMSATGQRPRYGNPNAPKWKAHGPTQSPFFGNMPGINPTANPLTNGMGTLDEYYRIWITFAEQQDQAQCALIPEGSRVKCMENFDALVDYKLKQTAIEAIGVAQASACHKAGCCFNEDAFLETGGAACYRATNYGTCTNLPENYIKQECGREGITENECLTNVNCCYKPSPDRKDPWCYYKYSATLREEEWCAAWSDKQYYNLQREECFATNTGKQLNFLDVTGTQTASNVNNLVGQAQCEAAGCCFDSSLDVDVIEWNVEGLGLEENRIYRCFLKKNPMIAATWTGENYGGQLTGNDNKLINSGDKDASKASNCVDPTDPNCDKTKQKADPNTYNTVFRKTCDANKWGQGLVFKRSCGENLSYYQCVYVNKCCYKPTVSNEPACYRPELNNSVLDSAAYKVAKDSVTQE